MTIDYWENRLLVNTSFIGYYFRNNWTDFHNQTYIRKYLLNHLNDILYII